jgi:hypothetical protein
MPDGARQLFIYWRVAAADAAQARQAVREWQRRLGDRHDGLRCALFERAGAAGGESTLMETYAFSAVMSTGGVPEAVQRQIEVDGAALLRPWLRSARHVEVFDACD